MSPSTGPSTGPSNRTTEIISLILRVDESLVSKHIQKLQDFDTRYSYRVDKCNEVTEYIHSVFEANGLITSYDPFTYQNYNMRNVIGEKPGTSTSDGVFIICAHLDSTAWAPWAIAPGADDNGSGTAAVLAVAEVLSDYEFNYTIRFIAFGGEEQGLQGSKHYAQNMKGIGANISGVINLDMIGYNPAGLTEVYTRTNILSQDLANYTVQTSMKYGSIINIQALKSIDSTTNSDHASFWPEYQANCLFELQFNAPNYHTPYDTIDKLNLTYCANTTQIALATLAELAELDSTDLAPPSHTPGFPLPGTYATDQPSIAIEVTDPSLLNLTSLNMWVNSAPITPDATPIPLGHNFSYESPITYTDGSLVNVTIAVNDSHGNRMNYTWAFTIDAVAPAPPTGLQISLTRIELEKRGIAIDVDGAGIDNRRAWSPSVIYHDGEYKMWYGARNTTNYHIAYANSSNGIDWNKYGVVLARGSPGDPDMSGAFYPNVIYHDGEYKMWYSGQDGTNCRIIYANSTDGITWVKRGLAFDLGVGSSYDTRHCYTPSVLYTAEYQMWYTGFNGDDFWLLYANSSNGINWTKHPEPLFTKQIDQRFSEVRVSHSGIGFDGIQYHMYYTGYDGLRYRVLYANSTDGLDWVTKGLAVNSGQTAGDPDLLGSMFPSNPLFIDNETKVWYSAYGSDGYYRISYTNLTKDSNKTGLDITWTPAASDDIDHYEICRANDLSGLTPWQTYLTINTTSFVENGIGDEDNDNYYYRIRAVDKVGQSTEGSEVVGKIGNSVAGGWNLVGNPFIEGSSSLTGPLSTIEWTGARAYDAYDPVNPWKSNITSRPPQLNTLDAINETTGVWVYVAGPETYARAGKVENITINLKAGWNLVAYPYHDVKIVSQALSGLPYDVVERADPVAPYDTSPIVDTYPMYPGNAYWIHLTSDAVWVALNQ